LHTTASSVAGLTEMVPGNAPCTCETPNVIGGATAASRNFIAGNALAEQGRVAEARERFEETLRIGLQTAHRRSEAEARANLALLDFESGVVPPQAPYGDKHAPIFEYRRWQERW